LHICLISTEIFAWGKYGGFGRATRMIGKELARRGIEVSAVVPRRMDQKQIEDLDGIRVYGFRPYDLISAFKLYKMADADIYHSQEPSMGTYLAMRALPNRKHAVTFRDTREAKDWRIEYQLPSLNPAQVIANWLYEDNWLVRRAVRQAHGWYAAAHLLVPKARAKYGLAHDPKFLPTPVKIPNKIQKAPDPTVCFVSRFDRRKRPEIFFELAKSFPDVHFLAAGISRDHQWDEYLRDKYGNLDNLKMLGFIDQFRSEEFGNLLGKSWIMVNTATREGLPNAFIEAAAYGCAILSGVDPDGFASRFGYCAHDNDFINGLNYLLQDDRWRELANKGKSYIEEVFALDLAIDLHIAEYEALLRPNITY
jgi:glycosyltransferase involved in cell wall biosynthesis